MPETSGITEAFGPDDVDDADGPFEHVKQVQTSAGGECDQLP
jgi:hypothetical protein